jgi:hypothetical protein
VILPAPINSMRPFQTYCQSGLDLSLQTYAIARQILNAFDAEGCGPKVQLVRQAHAAPTADLK